MCHKENPITTKIQALFISLLHSQIRASIFSNILNLQDVSSGRGTGLGYLRFGEFPWLVVC